MKFEEDLLNNLKIIERSVLELEQNISNPLYYLVDILDELIEADANLAGLAVVYERDKLFQQKILVYREQLVGFHNLYDKIKLEISKRSLTNTNNSSSTRLFENNKTVDNCTNMLEQSRQILFETEKVGGVALSDLSHQKEKLLSGQEHVRETKNVSTQVRAILRRMVYKAYMQKVIVISVALLLLVAIILVSYYGLVRKWKAI